jgi:hypothetical protein
VSRDRGVAGEGDQIRADAERIRTAVRRLGKEAATHRFTVEEKRALGEIVYRYGRRGWRTSENEVVRVAVNWLLADHRERGERSLLHRVLAALRA